MADLFDENYPDIGVKFAIIFVIDVSASMADHIEELSKSINNFLDGAVADRRIKLMTDIEIITFSHLVETSAVWSDISNVPHQKFVANGSTNIRDAMIKAKDDARQRTMDYVVSGIRAYKPWIILMTDGHSDPDKPVDDIAAELRQRERDGKVHVCALGLGAGFEKSELEKFTDNTLAITDWDFEKFFGWLRRSLPVVCTFFDEPKIDEDLIVMHEAFINNG